MRLTQIEITGFKSFAKKSVLSFTVPVTSVVGPNGSGKSNVVEAFRFVLGEQSVKSMRGKSGADLIFRGGNSNAKLARAAVSITFDNKDKVFSFIAGSDSNTSKAPVLFDSVTFSRELYADGTSKYSMNGTEIKLRTMVELLSSVNIGASGHHIISQGEADGILRATAKERRGILEDALGLKVYHTRIKESEMKLVRTLDTLKEVQSLRRELAPHMSFLKKQVEKVEKGRIVRDELENMLISFLSTERAHLIQEETQLKDATHLTNSRKSDLEHALGSVVISTDEETSAVTASIENHKALLSELQHTKRSIEQKVSRLEGMIEAQRRMSMHAVQKPTLGPSIIFAPHEYTQFLHDIEFFVTSIKSATTLDAVQSALDTLIPLIESLKHRHPQIQEHPVVENVSIDNTDIVLELETLQKDLVPLIQKELVLQNTLHELEHKKEVSMRDTATTIEHRYKLQSQLQQCGNELQILEVTKTSLGERKERFDAELKEAGFLFGPLFLQKLQKAEHDPTLNMHDARRAVDRLKIRLEEHSGIGHEVVAEYESTKERDAFLTRELVDIETSVKNLESLTIELKKVLDEKFTSGVAIINEHFTEFFKTMFGGGSAFLSITVEKKKKSKLSLENEDTEIIEGEEDNIFMERGIEVHVNIPEKKVKELNMLSGGERSLVSIALLFAMSQVNPPPFLVLDETDAALDEANSRRYGDMIEKLSEYSQLIVVTHNRETMSRASVLYGVTLGSDGGSKLLSIKFDEAVKVAK